MTSCSWVEYFVIYDVGLILNNLYIRECNVEKKFCILTKSAKVLWKTDLQRKFLADMEMWSTLREGSGVNLTSLTLSDNLKLIKESHSF